MELRESDVRCVGHYQEYYGGPYWYDYEYRCPECGKWGQGSDTAQINEDGTESYLCEACAVKVVF